MGGLIRVDGKAVAFTFGSPINARTFDVQVEKALPDYGAAYTVINREFAAKELRGYRYINRENDLGLRASAVRRIPITPLFCWKNIFAVKSKAV